MGGIDLMRGQIPAARLGLAEGCDGGLILDYTELPDALWTEVAPHLGLSLDPSDIERRRAVSRRHSKRPTEAFDVDGTSAA